MSCKPIKTLNMKNRRNLKLQNCRGFTLIEALIGFLILSIGMLGIASLQAISLKAGKTSVYGSVAMMKVDELFESMRANPSALASYTGVGASHGCTGTLNCTEADLAQEDVFWWTQNLKAGLPDAATTEIFLTPAIAPSKMATVTIKVNWVERKKRNARDQNADGSVNKAYTSTTNICTGIPC